MSERAEAQAQCREILAEHATEIIRVAINSVREGDLSFLPRLTLLINRGFLSIREDLTPEEVIQIIIDGEPMDLFHYSGTADDIDFG